MLKNMSRRLILYICNRKFSNWAAEKPLASVIKEINKKKFEPMIGSCMARDVGEAG